MNNSYRVNTFGIKFNCVMLQYNKLPRDLLRSKYGLEFDFYQGWAVVRSHCGRRRNSEKVVQYTQAKAILEHLIEVGFKEEN